MPAMREKEYIRRVIAMDLGETVSPTWATLDRVLTPGVSQVAECKRE